MKVVDTGHTQTAIRRFLINTCLYLNQRLLFCPNFVLDEADLGLLSILPPSFKSVTVSFTKRL